MNAMTDHPPTDRPASTGAPELNVCPLGGGTPDGPVVVARPGAVAFVGAGDPVARAVVVRHVRTIPPAGDDPRSVVERLAQLLRAGDAGPYPAVLLAVPSVDGVHVVVHGEVDSIASGLVDAGARADASLGSEHWSTPEREPMVRHLRRLDSIVVGPPSLAAGGASPIVDLVDGVVPSGGLIATFRTASIEGSIEPEAVAAAPGGPEPDPSLDHVGTPPVAPAEIPPSSGRQLSQLGGAVPQRPEVEGIRCSRGHFNHPSAKFCAHCGIAMHQSSFVVVRAERPPLGVLVFDSGEAFELADDVIVGRAPGEHPEVAAGRSRSLSPGGDVATLSRVHASVELAGWDVRLVDRGSLNGTFVWDPVHRTWHRLQQAVACPILPGALVAFGRRTARFESSIRTG